MSKRKQQVKIKVTHEVNGQKYENFEDIPEDYKEKIRSNAVKAYNESFNRLLDKFPNELKDCLYFALVRVIHENNLTGIFKHLDAMKILIKKSDENHPDLVKYFTEPIPKIIETKNENRSISYNYRPNKTFLINYCII
ncbi:MAG: hypothetical protein ACYDG2_24960, partial [Ruminiclostridium sp.]